jgi:hypothetical protein
MTLQNKMCIRTAGGCLTSFHALCRTCPAHVYQKHRLTNALPTEQNFSSPSLQHFKPEYEADNNTPIQHPYSMNGRQPLKRFRRLHTELCVVTPTEPQTSNENVLGGRKGGALGGEGRMETTSASEWPECTRHENMPYRCVRRGSSPGNPRTAAGP